MASDRNVTITSTSPTSEDSVCFVKGFAMPGKLDKMRTIKSGGVS